ncbi:insulinase family protein [Actinacidiphila soli]|uniref:insulinase family protein n=1 Tax=Actinacidiphila soli TaxID=2487275 RepID=UPI0013E3A6CB|nr:insulinase family protein [Actinacidiphila soli]
MPGDGYTLSHREMQCLRLFNTVLGGSASSRLRSRIRDREGLSYRVRSVLEPLADVGGLLTLFTCVPDGLPRILAAVRGVLDEMLTDDVTEQELARARAMTKGIYAREREDSVSHARLPALGLFRRGRLTSQQGAVRGQLSPTAIPALIAHRCLGYPAGYAKPTLPQPTPLRTGGRRQCRASTRRHAATPKAGEGCSA